MYVSQHQACLMLKLRTVGMGIINASKAQCGRYMYTGINGI